jgi:membrane associated rhomboid family serine protease
MFPLPPGTQALLWMNVGAFLLDYFVLGHRLSFELALWPIGSSDVGAPGFMPWQLLTYSFFHQGMTHIFFNMFGLVMFGGDVERVWGRSRFLTYYFVCVMSAGVAQLAFSYVAGSDAPTLGASGGLFGLLLAFALLFPQRRVIIFPIPVPVPAWLFVTIYGGIELLLGVTGTQAGVAHFAHLGGLLGGWLMIRYGGRRR